MNKKELTTGERDALLQKFDKLSSGGSADYDFGHRASWAGGNSLRERNAKKQSNWTINNPDTKSLRESLKRKLKRGGIDLDPIVDHEKFPVMKESFSWSKFREQLDSKFKEADSGTMYPLMLVAGVLQNVIGMYQIAKPSYMDWVTVTPTKLVVTPVAPLHGLSFPREVGEQMPYPVSKTAALSLKFTARKYGTMLEMTRELIEDDQTGQFQMLSGQLGEYLQLLTEVLVYGRLSSASGAQYSGFTPGVSETQPSGESNYPWTVATSSFIGGGFNKPASFGGPTVANIEAGMIALKQQKNLLGVLIPVNPKRIITGPKYMFDVAVILNSAYYPAGAQNAGTTGGAFSINPLKGIADLTVTPFMFDNTGAAANSSTAWYLVDDSKPFFQLVQREPVSVEQEAPNAGESFNRDVVRFKCSTRQIADFVDPRFAWQGNDGSV